MNILNPQPMPLNTGGPAGVTGSMQAQAKQVVPEKEPIEKGFELLKRMEPDIEMIAIEYSAASIAVSLRDISTQLHRLCTQVELGNVGQGSNLAQIAANTEDHTVKLDNISQAAFKLLNAKTAILEDELKRLRRY
mgnify:CR=1 FL=1